MRARLRISSLGMPLQPRCATATSCRSTCARTQPSCPTEVVARIDLNPLRAFDSDHPGTRAVMAGAPRLLDRLDREDAEHFAAVRALLDAAGLAVRGRHHAGARAGLLHAHGVRVHVAPTSARSRGVGGGGRYDGLIEQIGGPPTPGMGWAAGVERMLLAGLGARPRPRRRSTSSSRYAKPELRDAAFRLAADAAARRARGETRTRRPLAEGPAQAGATARAPATLPSSATRAPR